MPPHHVVILGAGAAGTAAARALAEHSDVKTTIVGRTHERPYMRMLVKGVAFGSTAAGLIRLPMPQADFVSDTVEHVDPGTRDVRLTSGATTAYDSLIVATGSRARALDANVSGAQQAALAGTLTTFRSLRDAVRIRSAMIALGRTARVAVYGAGLTASETASALQEQGHQISLIARSELPGVTTFGRSVAERVAADHQSRVSTFFGRTIEAIHAGPAATVVTLDDGSELAVDLIIIALGTTPIAPAPWRDGVDVDENLRAVDFGDVYAAGGVALHHDDYLGAWRIDHWDDAAAQGTHAARSLLHTIGRGDDPGPYRPRSAYMAMIFGRTIAGVGYLGFPDAHTDGGEEFIALHEHAGAVVGASGVDAVGAVYQWGQRLHEVYS